MSVVGNNIGIIFELRKAKIRALCESYAGKAIALFRDAQGNQQEYWDNQTYQAYALMFSRAFQQGNDIGWFLSHGVDYGIYLELANDRQREAIRPIIKALLPQFKKDLQSVI